MGNGSTPLNPFVVQLIPLAFSSDLILQLLLAQSAVHRVSSGSVEQTQSADFHYGRSLQLFRRNVIKHIELPSDNILNLAMGALIMCFTEVSGLGYEW